MDGLDSLDASHMLFFCIKLIDVYILEFLASSNFLIFQFITKPSSEKPTIIFKFIEY